MGRVTKILSFIFISVLLVTASADGQNNGKSAKKATDYDPQGFTLGLNMEGPIARLFDADKSAFSAVTHINMAPQWFFRGEAGFENLKFSPENIEKRNYAYRSNSTFIKAGMLYDFFEVEEKGNNDNIFVGLHYGLAVQEHGTNRYIIENNYWSNYTGSLDKYILNTHWIEISAGPRTELLKNFYMGWTINLRVAVYRTNREVLEPFAVPGFGRGDSNVNFGFSYVLEYLIPWQPNFF
jgi:hypothetical protein